MNMFIKCPSHIQLPQGSIYEQKLMSQRLGVWNQDDFSNYTALALFIQNVVCAIKRQISQILNNDN